MTPLNHLIAQFVDAQKDGNRARWRQIDIAAEVYAKAGAPGLTQLAKASGLTHDYLRMFVRTAAAFPPGTRRIELSYSHHHTAQRALNRFPEGTREHEPGFWLDQAIAQHYTYEQLEAVINHHTLAEDSLEARQANAAAKVTEAQRARNHVIADVERFNAVHAQFWGARLVVTEQALLNPAS